MSITLSTCWYMWKAKFDPQTYSQWIDNMLSNVNQYNLVVYTDMNSLRFLIHFMENPRIRIVLKPQTAFYNYKYVDQFQKNHISNILLQNIVDWKVNMLWCEKVHFVYETMENAYFDTDFYGWCDIGYFRNNGRDLQKTDLSNWCAPSITKKLSANKIYYALINNDNVFMKQLVKTIKHKNERGLPAVPIPADQKSIAGGFFLTHKDNIEWWRRTFDEKLVLYFQNDYLVKDDQILVADCVYSNPSRFALCKEDNPLLDNWFLFQRYLNP